MRLLKVGLCCSFLWGMMSPTFGADTASVTPDILTVDVQVGTGMSNGDVLGAAESFPLETNQLVGWTRIKGAQSPIVIKHVWSCDGVEKAVIELAVKSTNYRTWSRKTLFGQAGKWKLDVKGPDGSVIASKEFSVGVNAPPAAQQ